MFGTESSCKYHHHPPTSSVFVHFMFVWVLFKGGGERLPPFLHLSPPISCSCFASMVAGGRLHGEKTGLYHFSTEGWHNKLAVRLVFSHSQLYDIHVRMCISHLYVFALFVCLLDATEVCVCAYEWVSLSEDGCFSFSCTVSRRITWPWRLSQPQSDCCKVWVTTDEAEANASELLYVCTCLFWAACLPLRVVALKWRWRLHVYSTLLLRPIQRRAPYLLTTSWEPKLS